jgi:hypothetical protein
VIGPRVLASTDALHRKHLFRLEENRIHMGNACYGMGEKPSLTNNSWSVL